MLRLLSSRSFYAGVQPTESELMPSADHSGPLLLEGKHLSEIVPQASGFTCLSPISVRVPPDMDAGGMRQASDKFIRVGVQGVALTVLVSCAQWKCERASLRWLPMLHCCAQ